MGFALNFYPCAHCGKKRLLGYTPTELVFCSSACELDYAEEMQGNLPGPKLGVGTRSNTSMSRREGRQLDRLVGGKQVRGSGAIRGRDGDRLVGEQAGPLVSSRTMVEEKVTAAQSYRLTTLTWEKLLGEAARNGKGAALLLTLGPQKHRIVLMPLDEALTRLEDGL